MCFKMSKKEFYLSMKHDKPVQIMLDGKFIGYTTVLQNVFLSKLLKIRRKKKQPFSTVKIFSDGIRK